jgi:hypothetical protein
MESGYERILHIDGKIIQIKTSRCGRTVLVRNYDSINLSLEDERVFQWPLHVFTLEVYLNDLTTSFYASKIVEWMKGVK